MKDEKLLQIWLLFVPIINFNRIEWNATFFMTSFIARITYSIALNLRQPVLEKVVKMLMKKEIVNFEPLCRFQPNARPWRNFSSIAWNLNKFCGIFEKNERIWKPETMSSSTPFSFFLPFSAALTHAHTYKHARTHAHTNTSHFF